MKKKAQGIDWSDECWKEMLVFQRKSMWLDDTIDKLAAWFGLGHGITAVDVGCGLGYLGYTFWPYFGKGGRYVGVDRSPALLRDAARSAKTWADAGETSFVAGNAYELPFEDDFADWVMCQAVLMHLEDPRRALSEMIRVTGPGGLITCIESDNVRYMLSQHYSSLPELDIEDQLLRAKVALTCHRGRIARGHGDNAIGPRVPRMMSELGLVDIDVRLNDRVHFLDPPYGGPHQQDALDNVRKQWLDEPRRTAWIDRARQEFLEADGDPAEFAQYEKAESEVLEVFRQQIDDGTYFACASGDVYVIKARKPDGTSRQ
ncbi:MAG TPA: methyltransferase domain-containing protein [Acidobacteriota bacterium]|nr:methyltransferase domain-containing protein [Acidobacteriota bacterium]